MSRQIATITFNPAFDLVGFADHIERGEVNQIQTAGLHPAGKGINVAKVLSDLGANVTAGGLLGQDNIAEYHALFQRQSITDHCVAVEGRTRINVKLTESGDVVTDLNFSGFTVSQADWQQFSEQSLVWLAKMDMVCISGSLAQGIESTEFKNWLCAVKQVCPRILLDSSGEALKHGLTVVPWLIKPNHRELEQWADRQLTSLDDIQQAALQLQNLGIEHVVVSLGSAGALWVNQQGCLLAKPLACHVVSTVGAGDSMVAGLAWGLLNDQSIEQCLRLATAVAGQAVEQTGVGISDRQQLDTLMAKVEIQAVNGQQREPQ